MAAFVVPVGDLPPLGIVPCTPVRHVSVSVSCVHLGLIDGTRPSRTASRGCSMKYRRDFVSDVDVRLGVNACERCIYRMDTFACLGLRCMKAFV